MREEYQNGVAKDICGWPMANVREPYSDIRDLIEDSLDELARRRAKWPGDDLAMVQLLSDLAREAEAALTRRVVQAKARSSTWQDIAKALGTSVTEVRLQYEEPTSPSLTGSAGDRRP